MAALAENEIYAAIGSEGFERLCAAFYRQIPHDDVLGHMYPAEDLLGAEQRLRDFLIYRFGGPQQYIQQRGHPRLRQRHAPFAINTVARDRWLALMTRALSEAALPASATETLQLFFGQMATFLVNRSDHPDASPSS